MTVFGIDVSSYQAGLNISQVAAEGFSWVAAKVSEGSYFQDPTWAANQSAAAQAGLQIIGYHYANASDTPASQVQNWQANGGPNVCMIDFEDNSGNINDYWALVNTFNAAGVTVALSYIPQWYWSQIGSPDLSGVPGLIASAYPASTAEYATSIYASVGADSGEGWASYGGANPVIWQFTDRATVAGMSVDADAFRGSAEDLSALLQGDDMTPDQDAVLRDMREQICGQTGRDTGEYPGWTQLNGHTVVDALAEIGAHLGIPGYQAKAE